MVVIGENLWTGRRAGTNQGSPMVIDRSAAEDRINYAGCSELRGAVTLETLDAADWVG